VGAAAVKKNRAIGPYPRLNKGVSRLLLMEMTVAKH